MQDIERIERIVALGIEPGVHVIRLLKPSDRAVCELLRDIRRKFVRIQPCLYGLGVRQADGFGAALLERSILLRQRRHIAVLVKGDGDVILSIHHPAVDLGRHIDRFAAHIRLIGCAVGCAAKDDPGRVGELRRALFQPLAHDLLKLRVRRKFAQVARRQLLGRRVVLDVAGLRIIREPAGQLRLHRVRVHIQQRGRQCHGIRLVHIAFVNRIPSLIRERDRIRQREIQRRFHARGRQHRLAARAAGTQRQQQRQHRQQQAESFSSRHVRSLLSEKRANSISLPAPE